MSGHKHVHDHNHDHEHPHEVLNEEVREQVRQFFEGELQHPVRLVFFTGDAECMYCDMTQQMLEEVASLDDRVRLSVYNIEEYAELAQQYGIQRVPATLVLAEEDGQLQDYGIRFFGIPAEYEFGSLLYTIALVSKRDSGLSEPTRRFLSQLDQPVQLDVFVTPSCPYCPRMVYLAHQMALASPQVRSSMVEAMEFPEWAAEFGVSSVPHTVINQGAGTLIGAVPEGMLVEEIRRVLAEQAQ